MTSNVSARVRSHASSLDPRCSAPDDAQSLKRLRALLLDEDRAALLRLQRRQAILERNFEDHAIFRARLAQSLATALRDAQVDRPEQMANALSPLMLGAIRSEIVNSRDDMAEALYPITGRMVKAAVRDSINRLTRDINARIEGLISQKRWTLRARALISGKSVSELALAELAQSGVSRLLLIDRASGVLIARWSAQDQPDAQDSDLVGALISALASFTEDALSADSESLRAIELEGRSLVLHASPRHMIAVETPGALTAGRQRAIHQACVDFLEEGGGARAQEAAMPEEALSGLAARLASKPSGTRRRFNPVWLLLCLFVAALLAWGGYALWRAHRLDAAALRIEQTLQAHKALARAPVFVETDHEAGLVRVSGVAPADLSLGALETALRQAAGEQALELRFAQNPDIQPISADIEALQADIDHETMQRGVALRAMQASLAAALDARAPKAESALRAWTLDNAIFFEQRDLYIDNLGAARAFDALAALLSRTDRAIRLVGYGDASGSARRNREVGLARARRVRDELVARGVDGARLILLAGGESRPISGLRGQGSFDRRVEFELAFIGETAR